MVAIRNFTNNYMFICFCNAQIKEFWDNEINVQLILKNLNGTEIIIICC